MAGSALLEILGEDPIVGINALDDAGAPQGFQPAHMRLNVAAIVVIRHADRLSRLCEMLARVIEAEIVAGQSSGM